MTKKSLKHSLLMSVLAVFLCVTMLIGTTFAWFTDTASSGVNRIMAGNLDVEVSYKVGNNWVSIEGQDSLFSNNLWEPGHTEYVTLKVENKGTLALNYRLNVSPVTEQAGVNVNGGSFKLSDYLVFKTTAPSTTEPTYADRAAARTAAGIERSLDQTALQKDGTLLAKTPSDAANPCQYITLVIYMPETVGNEANYMTGTTPPSIDLGITVFAYQEDYEEDSFDKNYDIINLDDDEPAVVMPTVSYILKDSDSVSKTVDEDKDTVFTSAVTPAMTNDVSTKVTIPAGTQGFTDDDVAVMTVEAKPLLVANNAFTISSNGAVGAIELEVEVNGTPISDFRDSASQPQLVKVETYIAKNLTNVTLSYNNTETWSQVATEAEVDTVGKLFYDKTTGKLVYMTNHFSTFVLGADEVVYLERTNTAYKTLSSAEASIQDGDTLVMIKNYSNTTTIYNYAAWFKKDCTIDMNGHMFVGYYKYAPILTQDCAVTIEDNSANVGAKIENLYASGYAGIYLNGGSDIVLNNVWVKSNSSGIYITGSPANTLTVNDGAKIEGTSSSASEGAIYIVNGSVTMNGGTVLGPNGNGIVLYPTSPMTATFTLNDGTISGHSVIITSGNNGTPISTINIHGGNINGFIYKPDGGALNIDGGNFTGDTCVYAKSGTTTITGGTFHATGPKIPFSHVGSGAAATGDAIVIESCSWPGGDPVAQVVQDAIITSDNGNKIACICYDEAANPQNPYIDITTNIDYVYYKVVLQEPYQEEGINVAWWKIYDKNDDLIRTDIQKEDVFYTNSAWNNGLGTSGQKNCSLEALLTGGTGNSIATGEGMKLRCNVVFSDDVFSPANISKGNNMYLYLCGYTITGGTITFEKDMVVFSDTDNLESLFAGGTVVKTENAGVYTYTYTK